ncbi:unnamed protein product (macronuclear) [Paramecium tetraurelia]|uniref:Myb-like domain-containing protein n=1 Tax=Paramecium tetraurelia TaxID=5888 RepID=A0C9Q7_PARTE|nr:uncharacterized protein GSPATT00006830001 [Paramecium tetraurelia]CAK67524.1 unnamed protein product [Paramecium tetraurelia]|eukprot:XP_001434921.1 hypothetical protein (macronuclear) [Paramecium tetraurelia strain d4-2]
MKSENSGTLHHGYLELMINHSKQQDISNNTNAKQGHWSQEEHEQYVQFLLRVKGSGDTQRKGQPLFKRMSQIIGTRTPSQCRYYFQTNRSHHQKFNPFNPRLRKNHKKRQLIKAEKPFQRTKQLIRQYLNKHKIHSDDENQKE